jgi:hypothetical protein
MITWRARTHKQCDSALSVICRPNWITPEHAGALADRLLASSYCRMEAPPTCCDFKFERYTSTKVRMGM